MKITPAIIFDSRQAGNTTRQIDECIQQLFFNGFCQAIDHASGESNKMNRHLFNKLLGRLTYEHGLELREKFGEIEVDRNKLTVRFNSESHGYNI